MPKQYEDIRDSYLAKGKSEKEAKKIAAMTYNSMHPGHPMHPDKGHTHMMKKGGRTHKASAPKMPPMAPDMGPAMPGGGAPALPPGGPATPATAPGMKGGGTVESEQGPKKKWGLKGEEKDAHGKEVAMKRGGSTHKKKHFASGGSVRGDGIAERGHTRGKFR